MQVDELVVDSTYGSPASVGGYSQDEAESCLQEIVCQRLQHCPVHVVSSALRHDLTKRGACYQIYPEKSIEALEDIAERAGELDLSEKSENFTLDQTRGAVVRQTVEEISKISPGRILRGLSSVFAIIFPM